MPIREGSRTALRHVGGETIKRGDATIAEALAHAFDVPPASDAIDDPVRAHVHGFHSYPARLHPITAARLIDALSKPGGTVFDPFCGSGTVLVEARLAGRRAVGTDVNPLAIRLARLKTRVVPIKQRQEIVGAAKWIEEHVAKRRKLHAPVTRKYDREDVELFEPHVLLELDSIRDGLDRVEPIALREDVELVFSAILTKVSRRRGDSGERLEQRRLAPGYVARLLVAKAEELARQFEAFEKIAPREVAAADVHADDARTLGTIGKSSVNLIVTSPPYVATYDYLGHHDVRLRWLRLRADRFARLELGSRRAYTRLREDVAGVQWRDELKKVLKAFAHKLKDDALAVIVLADSAVGRIALRADAILDELAPASGLEVRAVVSQRRQHFHQATRDAFRDEPRREHVFAVGRVRPSSPGEAR